MVTVTSNLELVTRHNLTYRSSRPLLEAPDIFRYFTRYWLLTGCSILNPSTLYISLYVSASAWFCELCCYDIWYIFFESLDNINENASDLVLLEILLYSKILFSKCSNKHYNHSLLQWLCIRLGWWKVKIIQSEVRSAFDFVYLVAWYVQSQVRSSEWQVEDELCWAKGWGLLHSRLEKAWKSKSFGRWDFSIWKFGSMMGWDLVWQIKENNGNETLRRALIHLRRMTINCLNPDITCH